MQNQFPTTGNTFIFQLHDLDWHWYSYLWQCWAHENKHAMNWILLHTGTHLEINFNNQTGTTCLSNHAWNPTIISACALRQTLGWFEWNKFYEAKSKQQREFGKLNNKGGKG